MRAFRIGETPTPTERAPEPPTPVQQALSEDLEVFTHGSIEVYTGLRIRLYGGSPIEVMSNLSPRSVAMVIIDLRMLPPTFGDERLVSLARQAHRVGKAVAYCETSLYDVLDTQLRVVRAMRGENVLVPYCAEAEHAEEVHEAGLHYIGIDSERQLIRAAARRWEATR